MHRLPARAKRRHLGYVPGRRELPLERAEEIARAREEVHRKPPQRRRRRAPKTWDWRDIGGHSFVTPPKDQDSCLACTAFAVVATLETAMKVHHEMPYLDPDYSEGHLFNCLAPFWIGCGTGWSVEPALAALVKTGVVDEACYPWVPGGARCWERCEDWKKRVTKIAGSVHLTEPEDMKVWLATRGALVATMTSYEDLYSYAGGIYEHIEGAKMGGHAVSCVGYNDVERYWICKNSWGAWGEGGFFRIRYGQCGIGAEMWGVNVE